MKSNESELKLEEETKGREDDKGNDVNDDKESLNALNIDEGEEDMEDGTQTGAEQSKQLGSFLLQN